MEESRESFFLEIFKYFSYWYIYLVSIFLFFSSTFIYLRYAPYIYESKTKIKILDDSMDQEMALPTAMTIFNRSTINLENETEVLRSYSLLSKVINEIDFNIKYYNVGLIKTRNVHKSNWLDGVPHELKIKEGILFETPLKFSISLSQEGMLITDLYNDRNYTFKSYDSGIIENKLPFEIKVFQPKEEIFEKTFEVIFEPIDFTISNLTKDLSINLVGAESDILQLSYKSEDIQISNELLNTIITFFDLDGIKDRQLVFKTTIDFVDSRFNILRQELNEIELQKQNFKESNDLSYIENNISSAFDEFTEYDKNVFDYKAQLEIAKLTLNSIEDSDLNFVPLNLGLDDGELSSLINEYNLLRLEKIKFQESVGSNNPYLKVLDNQLNNINENLTSSIVNYIKDLKILISDLEAKELEYSSYFDQFPKNEKILRSIEREQEIKEAIYLLLLQKREEASINFAVTKPSIKVIDYAIGSKNQISPNPKLFYTLSLLVSLILPTLILYVIFYFDNKIHTRDQLEKKLSELPIIGEVPYLKNSDNVTTIINSKSRSALAESIRIIIANLNFVLFNKNKGLNNIILVTSSIKGEGKTIISMNASSILSSKFKKVLLVGADLRNPQLHKFLNIDKSVPGLTDIIYKDVKDWEKLVIKNDNLDVIVSGTIPPNPTTLLASKNFENFLEKARSTYDYVVIDSAPCILVSDTFEISKYVDTTIYVVRANYSQEKLCDFINDAKKLKKLNNINIVLNAVGSGRAYGYAYNYAYSYKYGYKYNYGYGYGYGSDE